MNKSQELLHKPGQNEGDRNKTCENSTQIISLQQILLFIMIQTSSYDLFHEKETHILLYYGKTEAVM